MRPDAALWAVVPAAGIGARIGGDRPKQYLALAGQPVLQHSLNTLLALPNLRAVAVAIAAGDEAWPGLPAALDSRVRLAPGGAERSDSVLSGLDCLASEAAAHDWVLVHDAARPCLPTADLERLVDSLAEDDVGGILALPVADTVKRADDAGRIIETVDRSGLWLAQTPQLFRYGMLAAALRAAKAAGHAVTDEASAIERAGFQPRLVPGSPRNIKVTRPADLALAENYLQADLVAAVSGFSGESE
ncbi:MAG: 2-C-methyl-D-erythritol 4-phosphate cytidylyltransferase [Pseudomonadota bacterium]